MYIYNLVRNYVSFPNWLYYFTSFTSNFSEIQLFHMLANIWSCQIFHSSHSKCEMTSYFILIFIFKVTMQCFLMGLLVIPISSFVPVFHPPFKMGWFIFLLLICGSSLYTVDTDSLPDICIIFSLSW